MLVLAEKDRKNYSGSIPQYSDDITDNYSDFIPGASSDTRRVSRLEKGFLDEIGSVANEDRDLGQLYSQYLGE